MRRDRRQDPRLDITDREAVAHAPALDHTGERHRTLHHRRDRRETSPLKRSLDIVRAAPPRPCERITRKKTRRHSNCPYGNTNIDVPNVLEGVDASAFASSSVRTVAYTSENVPSPATTLKFCSRHSAASAIPYVADPSSRLSNTLYELNETRRQYNCQYENKKKLK